MALPNPAPGDSVAADDIDQIRNHLEGGSGKTAPYHLRQSTGNFLITLATADGSNGFRINDSAGVQMFYVDSDGNITIVGTTTQSGALILPVSTTPAQTADGSVVWDSDDDILTIGDGSSRKTFYPGRIAVPEVLVPNTYLGAIANSTLTQNAAYLVPLPPLTRDVTITGIRMTVTTQNGNVDAGVYSFDGTTFTRVVSLGSTSCPAAAISTLNIADTALSMGTRYWLAFATDSATMAAGTAGYTVAGVTKAASFPLPTSITSVSQATATVPVLFGITSAGGIA